jgi:Zn-dependent peptidase ImmA (M78 family)
MAVLARRYHVSRAAMDVRLRHIGLIEPIERCGTPSTGRLDFEAIQSNDPDGRTAPGKEAA